MGRAISDCSEMMLPEFVGNRLIAISMADGINAPPRVKSFLRGFTIAGTASTFIGCERVSCLALEASSAVALSSRWLVSPDTATALDALSILRALPHRIEITSPATIIAQNASQISAWTDRFSIGQLYLYEGCGIAAVSSSATLLAQVFECEPDRTALLGFALTGSYIGNASPFVDVVKVSQGNALVLDQGRSSTVAAFDPFAYRQASESTLEQVIEAFVAAVRRMHSAFPDAEIELSGGLDSRLILAALPTSARRGKRAMTIGPRESGDARVATTIAEREGLLHRIIPSDGFLSLNPDQLSALIEKITLGYDHLANPLDKLAIVTAGIAAGAEPEARFGGQNGEILRGFYYPAQPINRRPRANLASRLLAWRVEANDRVSDQLLNADDFQDQVSAGRRELMATLLADDTETWGQALDRFYLVQRMPRWVGAGANNRFIARTSLYPFFDPEFIEVAMRLPCSAKRNSLAAYQMLARLDNGLACMPLDNGKTPARVQHRVVNDFDNIFSFGRKFTSKAVSRLQRMSKPVLGSTSAIDRWYDLGLFRQLPVKSLYATGLASRTGLDSLVTSNLRLDRASLGWLLLVESVARSIARNGTGKL